MNDDGLDRLVAAYVAGDIGAGDLAALERQLLASPAARAALRDHLHLDAELRARAERAADIALGWAGPTGSAPLRETRRRHTAVALAAALLLAAVGTALVARGGAPAEPPREAVACAVLARTSDLRWGTEGDAVRPGDGLPPGRALRVVEGLARIDFFSGASVVLEGPAEVELSSAWRMRCRSGRVLVQVPPAAHGFTVAAGAAEIVDLGTAFAVEVADGVATVGVVTGAVGVDAAGGRRELRAGQGLRVGADGAASAAAFDAAAVARLAALRERSGGDRARALAAWRARRADELADPRLIAAYGFDRAGTDADARTVPDLARRAPGCDGTLVLGDRLAGLWGDEDDAVGFRRSGSRVRVMIPGEFSAFTFACWSRIDGLGRWYNALFMADGYENGEPHWQIREDGALMLSVMVDDARAGAVDHRHHRVYSSPPFWRPELAGRWIHLASTYDPTGASVAHFVDGREISREAIPRGFLVRRLRIGAAEIGNWGSPFRDDPGFALRNLDGRIDELRIYDAALTPAEVAALHAASRPGEP